MIFGIKNSVSPQLFQSFSLPNCKSSRIEFLASRCFTDLEAGKSKKSSKRSVFAPIKDFLKKYWKKISDFAKKIFGLNKKTNDSNQTKDSPKTTPPSPTNPNVPPPPPPPPPSSAAPKGGNVPPPPPPQGPKKTQSQTTEQVPPVTPRNPLQKSDTHSNLLGEMKKVLERKNQSVVKPTDSKRESEDVVDERKEKSKDLTANQGRKSLSVKDMKDLFENSKPKPAPNNRSNTVSGLTLPEKEAANKKQEENPVKRISTQDFTDAIKEVQKDAEEAQKSSDKKKPSIPSRENRPGLSSTGKETQKQEQHSNDSNNKDDEKSEKTLPAKEQIETTDKSSKPTTEAPSRQKSGKSTLGDQWLANQQKEAALKPSSSPARPSNVSPASPLKDVQFLASLATQIKKGSPAKKISDHQEPKEGEKADGEVNEEGLSEPERHAIKEAREALLAEKTKQKPKTWRQTLDERPRRKKTRQSRKTLREDGKLRGRPTASTSETQHQQEVEDGTVPDASEEKII